MIPQKPKPWTRRAIELFSIDSPFGHKVEKDKTKYNRKIKHSKSTKELDDDSNQ
jgi:hypothetical protein